MKKLLKILTLISIAVWITFLSVCTKQEEIMADVIDFSSTAQVNEKDKDNIFSDFSKNDTDFSQISEVNVQNSQLSNGNIDFSENSDDQINIIPSDNTETHKKQKREVIQQDDIIEESLYSEKLLNLSYICQNPGYPTGCEGISAVMVLRTVGVYTTPEIFSQKI